MAHLKVSLTYHIPDCLANVHHLTPFLYPHGYPTGFLATMVNPAHSCSVTLSHSALCNSLNCSTPGFPVLPHLPEFAQTHIQWIGNAIQPSSSSVIPLFSCLQSFPASGSFPVSQLFASGGKSIGASASASVLSMNSQGWFPLGLTGLISLQSKGLSRVFSNTTVQKHQFFSSQPSLWSSSHICMWLLEKP